MSKYLQSNFLQISRKHFENGTFTGLSIGALSLYIWLKELEHRYCSKGENSFFKTDSELSQLLNVSTKSIERYRKELVNAKLVNCERVHFYDSARNKYSEKRVLCYSIIDDP